MTSSDGPIEVPDIGVGRDLPKVYMNPLLPKRDVVSMELHRRPSLAGSTAIAGVTVIDPRAGMSTPEMTVVFDCESIIRVAPTSEVEVDSATTTIDGRGKFLLPGLLDMHVYWYERESLGLFIANGVTAVRQMWGGPDHHRWRRSIEARELVGPHLVIASDIIDGPNEMVISFGADVTSAEDARRAVAEAAESCADFVRVHDGLSLKAFLAVASECRRIGLPFAGPVPAAVPVSEASAAGIASIEHLLALAVSVSEQEEALRARLLQTPRNAWDYFRGCAKLELEALRSVSYEKAEKLFEILAFNGTMVTPTLAVHRTENWVGDPRRRQDPRLKYFAKGLRDDWLEFLDGPADPSHEELMQLRLNLVGDMHRAGVRLLAGGVGYFPFCFPGFTLHEEMELLATAGLSPIEVIKTATLNPSDLVGGLYGSISPGGLPDLLLLSADPLDDIRNSSKIDAVVIGGSFLHRSRLDVILEQLASLSGREGSFS